MDRALDDTMKKSVHGENRFTRITPVSGLTAGIVTLDTAVVSDVTWELPASVFNLSRSYLSFTVNVPSQGDDNYSHTLLNGCAPISRIVLSTRTGVNLVDINNFQNFMLTTGLATTPLQEYLNADVPSIAAAATHSTTGIAPTSLANLAPILDSKSEAKTANQTRFNIPLKNIAHSLFALDKLMYFGGEILNLRISFAPSSRVAYEELANTTKQAIAGAITILATPYVYLAVEVHPDVRAMVMNKFLKGFSFKTGYAYGFRYASTAAASPYTTNIRLNRGHGAKLLRIYTANMHTTESNSTSHTSAAITDFRSMLDQQWLSDNSLSTISNEDWMYFKHWVAGSALVNNTQRYGATALANGQMFVLDQFCTAKPHEHADDEDDGIDLTQERQYTTNITTAAASTIYQFVVVQRTVSIAAGLIQIV